MNYKIVGDSCAEIPEYLKDRRNIVNVPFGMELDGKFYVDEEGFDTMEWIRIMAASPNCPKSSCPSPEDFMKHFTGNEKRIYVITISKELSGSYNSAVLAKSLYEEEHDDKDIIVIDSLSAAAGETAILTKLVELEEMGLDFQEISERILKFRDEHILYFVLDNLETLRKNGRLSKIKAGLATTLKIKPITYADKGVIEQRGQAVGLKKALQKMVEYVMEDANKKGHVFEERNLVITHCNCEERAQYVKSLFEEKATFKDVIVVKTQGLATMYANDGGIIVAC